MSRSAPRTRWGIAAMLVCAAVAACKHAPRGSTAEPMLADDIASIEEELERNADDLEAEGIYVARAPSDAAPQRVQQQEPKEESESERERVTSARSEPASEQPSGAPRSKSRESYWERWLAKRGRKKNEAERCQRICDLAEATCELADRICQLAERHPDEVRYDEACSRAEHQCRVAADACTACVE